MFLHNIYNNIKMWFLIKKEKDKNIMIEYPQETKYEVWDAQIRAKLIEAVREYDTVKKYLVEKDLWKKVCDEALDGKGIAD